MTKDFEFSKTIRNNVHQLIRTNSNLCTQASGKVCGSDGITYTDLCHLQNASCATRKKIFVAHAGECGTVINSLVFHCLPQNHTH